MNRRALDAVPVASLVVAAAIAWSVTALLSLRMGAMMAPGLASFGSGMSGSMGMDATLPLAVGAAFAGMWVAMMSAMMIPTIVPFVRAHALVVRQQNRDAGDTAALVAGYLVIWFAVGLIPASLFALAQWNHPMWSPGPLRVVAGAVLLLAGAYQFTNIKARCLAACRSPLSFLMTHDFGAGASGAFRTGVSHGLFCLGCCWALMVVLGVVGFMNLAWMAVLAVFFFLEKNWRHGVGLGRVIGASVAALGIFVGLVPGLLGTIS